MLRFSRSLILPENALLSDYTHHWLLLKYELCCFLLRSSSQVLVGNRWVQVMVCLGTVQEFNMGLCPKIWIKGLVTIHCRFPCSCQHVTSFLLITYYMIHNCQSQLFTPAWVLVSVLIFISIVTVLLSYTHTHIYIYIHVLLYENILNTEAK
jgi:hypothetical protein